MGKVHVIIDKNVNVIIVRAESFEDVNLDVSGSYIQFHGNKTTPFVQFQIEKDKKYGNNNKHNP